MKEDPDVGESSRQTSPSRKPPIVDNFALLFYNKDDNEPLSDVEATDGNPEQNYERSFRTSLRGYLENIDDLRKQITDKYQAKQLIQVKLDAQLLEMKQQSRYNNVHSQVKCAVKMNYQRMRILFEKIYSLSLQLQSAYMELADILDKRAEHTMGVHKLSRICASALYDNSNRSQG